MKLYRKIILLALTLLLLVSSTGMAVGMHLCGGELRDLTLFGAAADCPMEQPKEAMPACHAPKQGATAADDCCENHQVELKRLDTTADETSITIAKPLDIKFLAAFRVFIVQLFLPETVTNAAFALYTSPPLSRDIPVLVQSFLL